MGKLGSLITTAVFIGAVAVLVYFCCRVKRKRNLNWNNWQDAFRQTQPAPGHVPPIGPGPYEGQVPHSIVNPNVSYPYGQPYPYPGPGVPVYPSQHATPYPVDNPANMPMPVYDARQMQAPLAPNAPYTYPNHYPDELPPPYSAVVGSNAPKY